MLFGLQTLFDAVSDPSRAERLKDLYSFTHKDMTVLTAQYDVFPIETSVALYLAQLGAALFPHNSLGFRALRKLSRSVVRPKGFISRPRTRTDDS